MHLGALNTHPLISYHKIFQIANKTIEFFKKICTKITSKAFWKKWWPVAAAAVVVIAVATTLIIVLDKEEDKTAYNNETDPLVFATLEVDKVFNPFFSTSATDSNVVGMTQIGMLSNDKDGKYTYGDPRTVPSPKDGESPWRRGAPPRLFARHRKAFPPAAGSPTAGMRRALGFVEDTPPPADRWRTSP